MAHHGGRTSLPRAHRPRAPIMSVPAPLTAPLTPLRTPPPVTLAAPRPNNERATNEYVETPIRVAPPSPPPQPHRPPVPTRLDLPPPAVPTAVTKQPSMATSFSKDTHECTSRPSIMCPECTKCRCDQCQQPKPLPSCWICDNHCFCSADAIIDYATCLCCVKGLFYHCSDTDGGSSCADEPCGCSPERRGARWGCLAALSCILPCLWCYWPLQGCKQAVEVCYSRHSRQGCRCTPIRATPEKRLLVASPDF